MTSQDIGTRVLKKADLLQATATMNGHIQEPPEPAAAVDNPRPVIDAGDADLERTGAQAWAALQRANQPPRMFGFGGLPVRVECTEEDWTPIVQTLTENRMSHQLARAATWFKSTDKGEKSAAPPMRLVKDLLASSRYPLPRLQSIVQVPVFAPDGSLSTTPGYHPAGATIYAPVPGFAVPAIPETPSVDDLAQAKAQIVDELLADFPFCGEAERANAVALFLNRFIRNLINGPTPLHSIEAPDAGTGKGLLADVLLRVAVGTRINIMSATKDEDEWRKRITAQLSLLPEIILIDNVVTALDSGSLSAVLTAESWIDRRLGVSEMVQLPNRCAWVATANNPTMSTELARRTVRIRLDAKMDRPWLRQASAFRHENLREWVDEHRADLVWSALVLVKHWIAEGSPAGTERLGSFEHWASVLGGILGCAGIDGFLGNLETFYEEADLEGAIWRQFVTAWYGVHGENEVGANDLFAIANTVEGFDFGKGPERSQRTSFGIKLNRQRDRVIGEYRILNTRTVKHLKRWRLIRARSGDNPFAALFEDGQETPPIGGTDGPGADRWTA